MNDDNYCGFSCGDRMEELKGICDATKEFSHHNPEYALIMVGKYMEMIYNLRADLMKMEEKDWQVQMERIKSKK